VDPAPAASSRWPNKFSRLIGDKAFGLLMADRMGVPVPRTLVIPRRVAPFAFGRETGSTEVWTPRAPLSRIPVSTLPSKDGLTHSRCCRSRIQAIEFWRLSFAKTRSPLAIAVPLSSARKGNSQAKADVVKATS
jgi:hypothetical protein